MSTIITLPPNAPGEVVVTPDELLTVPDGKHYELVDGVPVERTMSLLASQVASNLNYFMVGHCKPNGLGWVLESSCGYQCFAWKPSLVRRPDVSFIERGRLPAESHWSEGYVTIPPDLAVEVTTPNDEVYKLEEKVEEYLRAGVRLIWVIHPEVRVIEVIRGDGSGYRLRAGDELSGEDVVPGFCCPVASLFPTTRPAGAGETMPGPTAS